MLLKRKKEKTEPEQNYPYDWNMTIQYVDGIKEFIHSYNLNHEKKILSYEFLPFRSVNELHLIFDNEKVYAYLTYSNENKEKKWKVKTVKGEGISFELKEKSLPIEGLTKTVMGILEDQLFPYCQAVQYNASTASDNKAVFNAPAGLNMSPDEWNERYSDKGYQTAWIKAISQFFQANVITNGNGLFDIELLDPLLS